MPASQALCHLSSDWTTQLLCTCRLGHWKTETGLAFFGKAMKRGRKNNSIYKDPASTILYSESLESSIQKETPCRAITHIVQKGLTHTRFWESPYHHHSFFDAVLDKQTSVILTKLPHRPRKLPIFLYRRQKKNPRYHTLHYLLIMWYTNFLTINQLVSRNINQWNLAPPLTLMALLNISHSLSTQSSILYRKQTHPQQGPQMLNVKLQQSTGPWYSFQLELPSVCISLLMHPPKKLNQQPVTKY